ncbi:hypothetical protein CSB95_0013 [Pseudomonas aeruginosa]|uniref:hypothetical protein n=1 Tax=Pseudomonas aeruginosa TaxID=287 RepID=UPI000D40B951|nr:hypothetical protein [Pseudomonas aeruginosa]PRW05957.1 hypothetical protein CSB95_0013 [Pseudomonas aeruginosa]
MALTKDRNTPRRDGMQFNDPVAANAKIFAGSLVCLDASGNAVPGALSTTIAARGIAQEQVDNTVAPPAQAYRNPPGVYSSSPTVPRPTRSPGRHRQGVLHRRRSDGRQDLCTDTRSVAGVVRDVDDGGVWVEI